MELKQCLLTNNDCYKKGQMITPKGIIVHSTGVIARQISLSKK